MDAIEIAFAITISTIDFPSNDYSSSFFLLTFSIQRTKSQE